jgi:hypothetical protein
MMKRWAIWIGVSVIAVSSFAAPRRRAVSPPAVPVTSGCAHAVLASPYYSSDVIVDDSFAYFGDDTGGLFRVPKAGGAVTKLAQLNEEDVSVVLIVLDGNTIYFATSDIGALVGTIYSMPKSGGVPTALVNGVVTPYDMVVDATNIYWTSFGTPTADGDIQADGKVEKASKSGAGRTTLASSISGPTSLAVDDTNVYFVEAGIGIGNPASGVRAVAKNGGTRRSLVDHVPAVALTIDASNVYYSTFDGDSGDGVIARVAKSGGAPATLFSADVTLSLHLRLLGDTLYAHMLTEETEGIGAISLATHAVRPVVDDLLDTIRFALDDCAVYYVTFDDTVERAPR